MVTNKFAGIKMALSADLTGWLTCLTAVKVDFL